MRPKRKAEEGINKKKRRKTTTMTRSVAKAKTEIKKGT